MTVAGAAAIFNRSSSVGGNSEVSTSDPMPPPPAPSPMMVDDLAGRKTITLKRTSKKKENAPMLKFYISETLSVENKKILRLANDPCGGSFDVINFRRLGKPGEGGKKIYEFSFVENYGADLYESAIFFLHHMKETALQLPKLSELEMKGDAYDVSKIGDHEFTEDVYEVGDLKVFMKYQFGSWHMIIRKYKTKAKPNEPPYFQFGLPEYHMFKFACVMKYFIYARGLRTPTMLTLRETKLCSKLQQLVDYQFGDEDEQGSMDEDLPSDLPALESSDSEVSEIAELFDSVEDEQESQDMLGSGIIDELMADSSASSASSSSKKRRVD